MILRRLAHDLRDQNWTAIAIEFVLLVMGVFLGMQVNDWNQARADRAEYHAALKRLEAEIDTNLAALDTFDQEIAASIATATKAFDALQSCVESEENRGIVDAGIEEIRGTSGLDLRRNALNEITSNPRLLSQQSARQRERFAELLFYFNSLRAAADIAERGPEVGGMELNPLVGVGPAYLSSSRYLGFDWTSTRRRLQLKAPMTAACHDNLLIKAFFNWERRQGSLPVIARKWRAELSETKKVLGEGP